MVVYIERHPLSPPPSPWPSFLKSLDPPCSQFCSFAFLSFFWRHYLFCNGFPSFRKFWSCSCLSFCWLSFKLLIAEHITILVPTGMVFVIILGMFHGKIYLNLMLLLLVLNFLRWSRLELMCISFIVNVSSILTNFFSFLLLVLLLWLIEFTLFLCTNRINLLNIN